MMKQNSRIDYFNCKVVFFQIQVRYINKQIKEKLLTQIMNKIDS